MRIEITMGKRKSFSLTKKRSLLKACDKLPKTSQQDAAVKLGVPQATLCCRLKLKQLQLLVMETENECERGKHLV